MLADCALECGVHGEQHRPDAAADAVLLGGEVGVEPGEHPQPFDDVVMSGDQQQCVGQGAGGARECRLRLFTKLLFVDLVESGQGKLLSEFDPLWHP